MVFICIFLLTKWCPASSCAYWLAVCFLWRNAFSWPFPIFEFFCVCVRFFFGFLVFLLLCCRNYLHILSINPLSIYDSWAISIPGAVISLSWKCPLMHKRFSFWGSNFLIFSLLPMLLVLFPRNDCQIQSHEDFPLCFHLRVS